MQTFVTKHDECRTRRTDSGEYSVWACPSVDIGNKCGGNLRGPRIVLADRGHFLLCRYINNLL
jgi:hypothetical protein